MAVLVEALSAVIDAEALEDRYPGGWDAFSSAVPNRTLCADGDLVRVGFMDPADMFRFGEMLESYGLRRAVGTGASDFAFVDQLRGLTVPCDWLESGTVDIAGIEVRACRRVGSESLRLVAPDGWQPEGSLSKTHGFVTTEKLDGRLTPLRTDDGTDVYRDEFTGEEVYVGRTTAGDGRKSG